MHILFFIEAHFQFEISSRHIPGVSNTLANYLSRNQMAKFHANLPHADTHPSHVPPFLLQWLLDTTGLDITTLDQEVQYLCEQGIASSTRKTYQTALRRFAQFCTLYNVLTPFPVSESLLCYFATHLSRDKLAPQTIKVYLGATLDKRY